jgi:DnaJ-class molecular chaperone
VRTRACFEVLGLPETASAQEVKLAFRDRALLHHPDRGGDPTQFQRLRLAYAEALALASRPKVCQTCAGRRTVQLASGFNTLKRTCPACRGTGLAEEKTDAE